MSIMIYTNPSARICKRIELEWNCASILRKEVKTSYEPMCGNCKCLNINGGCPPIAPRFETITPEFLYMFVFYIAIGKEEMLRLREQMSYYTFMKVKDKIMSCMLKRLGSAVEHENFLWCGACKVCMGGARCAYGKGLTKCFHPEKRRYSLEATGVIVDSLTSKLFSFNLEWLKPDFIPNKQICIGGILFDGSQARYDYLAEKLGTAIKAEEQKHASNND